MSDRPLPKTGDFYRHYKGKIAMILGVAKGVAPSKCSQIPFCYAQPIDVPGMGGVAAIEIRQSQSELFFGYSFQVPDLVVYCCSGKIWCREIGNFLEVLEQDGDRINRFTRIEVEVNPEVDKLNSWITKKL